MKKKDLPEILVKVVRSLHEGAEIKVRVGSGLSKKFSVKVGVHQGSVLSPLLFAMVTVVPKPEERGGMGGYISSNNLTVSPPIV